MKSFLLLTFIVTAFAGFCQQNCVVPRFIDCDTYKVLLNDKIQTVQLLNTDAPEKGKYFGKESCQHVASLILSRMVAATFYDKDLYDRRMATVTIDDNRFDSWFIASRWTFTVTNVPLITIYGAGKQSQKVAGLNGSVSTTYCPGSFPSQIPEIKDFTRCAIRLPPNPKNKYKNNFQFIF